MPKRVFIPIVGPSGLKVDHHPHVSVYDVTGEGRQARPPDPDDPYVVCFTDLDQFRSSWRRAGATARRAMLEQGSFGIVIEQTEVLPRETLDIVRKIGREAGIKEVRLGVRRLK